MKTTTAIAFSTLITVGSGFLLVPDMAGAEGFGPMNMMNPSRWFGGGDRDYDAPYYADRGYGPPPPGYGPPPMGAPGYGYAPPPPVGGYGYTPPTAAPGYTAPASTPTTTTSGVDSQTRIRELEDRIRQLEAMLPAPGSSATTSNYGGGNYQPDFAGGSYQPDSSSGSYQPSSIGSSGYPSIPPTGTYEPSSPVFRPNN